jgi:hypothetical protein
MGLEVGTYVSVVESDVYANGEVVKVENGYILVRVLSGVELADNLKYDGGVDGARKSKADGGVGSSRSRK